MDKKYMTVEEIADRLQVKPRTIQNWIKEKGLPSLKLGKAVRFDVEAVDKWVYEYNEKSR